ncbi:MAG TPA: DUF4160 domain-containing protein [Acetobacteraceae bacterium]
MIYQNDHPPAHVHVLGPGWAVVVELHTLEVRQNLRASEIQARQVARIIAEHQEPLLHAWRQLHA